MSVLVVGSVALDSVETPFGKADNVVGGSGTFFSAAASLLAPVQLVGVVGDDYPLEQLEPLRQRGVDMAGLEQVARRFRRSSARHHSSFSRTSIRASSSTSCNRWNVQSSSPAIP